MQATAIRKIVRSTGWLSIALGLGQVVNFLCVLLAAKFLAPSEYGAYSTGMIIVAFTAILGRFGILEAVVQFGARDVIETTTATVVSFLFALASWVVTGLAGLLLAYIWDAPALVGLAFALGFSSFCFGLQSLPEALLRKDLDFRRIALVRLVATLTGGLTLATWIFVAPSVWALVAQRLVTETMSTILLWLLTRPRLGVRWSGDYARNILHFSRSIGAANVVDVLGSQLDQIIVRGFWGEHGLGLYAMAKRLLANIQQFLFLPFRQVAVAALAKLDGDLVRMRQAYLQGTRTMAAVGVFAAWTLFLGIDPVVQQLFSFEWLECIIILKILSWALIYDAIAVMYPAVLQAARKPQWIVLERIALVIVGCVAISFIALAGYPVQNAAYSVLLQSYLTLPLIVFFIWRVLGTAAWHALKDLAICLLLASTVFLLSQHLLDMRYVGRDTLVYLLKLSVPASISITIMACYLRFAPRMTAGEPARI